MARRRERRRRRRSVGAVREEERPGGLCGLTQAGGWLGRLGQKLKENSFWNKK
jgi:hypothetical protein